VKCAEFLQKAIAFLELTWAEMIIQAVWALRLGRALWSVIPFFPQSVVTAGCFEQTYYSACRV